MHSDWPMKVVYLPSPYMRQIQKHDHGNLAHGQGMPPCAHAAQLADPACDAYRPDQSMGTHESTEDQRKQLAHHRVVEVPAWQISHAPLPATAPYLPRSQLRHCVADVAAVLGLYLPVEHALHSVLPTPSLYLPILQSEHFAAPGSEYLPAPQAEHDSFRPRVLEYLPPWHATHEEGLEEPTVELHFPTGRCTQ